MKKKRTQTKTHCVPLGWTFYRFSHPRAHTVFVLMTDIFAIMNLFFFPSVAAAPQAKAIPSVNPVAELQSSQFQGEDNACWFLASGPTVPVSNSRRHPACSANTTLPEPVVCAHLRVAALPTALPWQVWQGPEVCCAGHLESRSSPSATQH